jgi:hypothetical protein
MEAETAKMTNMPATNQAAASRKQGQRDPDKVSVVVVSM